VVHVIITEKAAFEVTPTGLVLKEVAPGLTVADIMAATEAEFTVSADLHEFHIGVPQLVG
jgi:acyl CoA:acetate/3-ketoacid CoA transferase beta subunit